MSAEMQPGLPERCPGESAMVPMTPVRSPGGCDNVDNTPGILEYWRMIMGRKAMLLGFVVAGTLLAVGFGLLRKPLYVGHVAIEIQETNADFLNLRVVDPTAPISSATPDAFVSTQAKVLESRALTAAVVDRLGLAESAGVQGDKWYRRMLKAAHANLDALPWLRKLSPRERAVGEASKALRVKTTPANYIVEIDFEWTDPKTATDFANTLAAEFIEQSVEARWKSSQRIGEWLMDQLKATRSRLESLERKLQQYSRESGFLFTSDKENVADEKLRQIQAELSRAQADRAIRQSSYELSRGAPEALPEVQDSPRLKEYATRLADMRRELAVLNLSLTPTHYKVVRLKAQIEEQERAIEVERKNAVARIQNEYERASAREKLLSAAYEAQAKIVAEQAARRAHYNVLTREVETNRRIYDSMLEKVRDTGVAAAIRASNIRVVDPATPETRPSKPKLWLNAAGGGFSGLLLAFGLIIFSERANRTFRVPEEMSLYLGTLQLGVIPSAGGRVLNPAERSRLPRGGLLQLNTGSLIQEPKVLELSAWHERSSMFAEYIRAVLTSVMLRRGQSTRPKVLALTSSAPREGKTTVITNLAIALTEMGMSVALVDCDLRHPRLQSIFGLPNIWGVSSLVMGNMVLSECPLQALVQSTQIPSLYVTTSGPGTATVSGVLISERLRELIERLRKEFDAVLIDTPPVGPVADARLIGRVADGVILVVRANRTDRDDALAAAQRLFGDGTRILGAVLNDWDPKASTYYGYK